MSVPGARRFRYDGYEVDPEQSRVVCRYSTDERHFTEEIGFTRSRGEDAWAAAWASGAADAAARIIYLLAGVSYYKTAAPLLVDLGETETTRSERAFLHTFFTQGLAEFAFRNGLDLSGLEIRGPEIGSRALAATAACPDRPLVPFGAGIDSIVTAEDVSSEHPQASLFVVSRARDRFSAIEHAALVTGLPIVRAQRQLDPVVLRSSSLGLLNGHVPVTGVISAVAVMASVLGGHDAVVMSNERSSSDPTLWHDGRPINHQWSKGAQFEAAFSALLAESLAPAPTFSSHLRRRSELWVAERFSALRRYHRVFRSCNRAFAIDPAQRLDHWCAVCDKCCFVDLVLAPYMDTSELGDVFDGHEPLFDAGLLGRFRALVGTGEERKPFECVGDLAECREATLLAAARPDRAGCAVLQTIASEVRAAT